MNLPACAKHSTTTMKIWKRMPRPLVACGLAGLMAWGGIARPAVAGPVLDRVRAAGVVKVCSRSDYHGISYRNPRTAQWQGIEVELLSALAQDLGVRLQHVESTYAELVANLQRDTCDVAASIAVTPERRVLLHFTSPHLQSDVYGLTTRFNHVVTDWASIDRPGVRVAVMAGSFVESVMTKSLRNAQLVKVRPPATREQELESGRVDVFMTDYAYSRRLMDNADWVRLVPPPTPFHVVPYAYAVTQGDADWLARLENFVQAVRADGRLMAAAARVGLSPMVVPPETRPPRR